MTLLISLDLEAAQPSGRIIQIGACVGNLETGEILETFDELVDPGEPLSEFIVNLTGITDAQIAERGQSLISAHNKLNEFLARYPNRFLNVLTWGGGDSNELREQLVCAHDEIIIGKTFDWHLGRRWLDVKTLFQFRQFARGAKPQAGLAKAMVKCGLNFSGRKHNGKDDSINTFRLARHLMNELNK